MPALGKASMTLKFDFDSTSFEVGDFAYACAQ